MIDDTEDDGFPEDFSRSLGDIAEEFMTRLDMRRINPLVLVNPDTKALELATGDNPDGYRYPVYFDELETPKEIMDRLLLLLPKRWFSKEHAERFIEEAARLLRQPDPA